MSDTVKKILGWVVGITVLCLFVAFALPSLLKKAFGSIGDLFKSDKEKEKEEKDQAFNKALEEWAKKQNLPIGKDYNQIAEQCKVALEGWSYNWEKLNSVIRGNKLTSAELVMVFTAFDKKWWMSWNEWGNLDLIQIFIYELNDEHYKTMKTYWSKTPLANRFTR